MYGMAEDYLRWHDARAHDLQEAARRRRLAGRLDQKIWFRRRSRSRRP